MTELEEALVIVMEECNEVAQEASKQIRFGKSNINKEIGDLLCMLDILDQHGILDADEILREADNKKEKLKIWSNLNIR